MNIIENLYYTKNHEWIRIEDDLAYVGITDYAQSSVGDIVFVELPEIDDSFTSEDTFAVIESVKAAADVYLPISGTINQVNTDLEDAPEQINEDPYKNHICTIKDFDKDKLKELMTADEYKVFCQEL